jgi:hypothetical protein
MLKATIGTLTLTARKTVVAALKATQNDQTQNDQPFAPSPNVKTAR